MHQRKNYWVWLIGLLIIFVLTSCGDGDNRGTSNFNERVSSSDSNESQFLEATAPSPSLATAPAPAANITVANTTGDNTTAPQVSSQRIIIKSASLTLTVENPAASVQDITQLAETSGGWIVSSNVTAVDEELIGEITVRVPAEQFTSILATIKSGALQVDREEVHGQDVTQEYTDLESALVNLELAEEQIQGFLELAENTDEVLRIHDKLTAVHGQIETIQGRLRYYGESATYSSIAVTLYQPAPEIEPEVEEEKPVVQKDDTWRPGQTFEDAVDSMIGTLQVIADVLIWLVVFFMPILFAMLLLGSPLWFGWRYWRRRQTREAPAN